MEIDERKVVLGASVFAVAGIALLFLMGETPQQLSVAQALLAQESTLARVSGTAANVSAGKFSLCERLCITVHDAKIPTAPLLSDGRQATVLGRIMQYQGSAYIEAEGLEVS